MNGGNYPYGGSNYSVGNTNWHGRTNDNDWDDTNTAGVMRKHRWDH